MQTIDYPSLIRRLKSKHKDFFEKYRFFLEKNISNRMLERTTLYARLQLVAQALKEAGVINSYGEAPILGHSNSIVLYPSKCGESVYLLNDCTEVIILAGCIASEDALSGRIILAQGHSNSAQTSICKRISGVLDDGFNWEDFSMTVLDVIHQSIYSKDSAKKDLLAHGLFGDVL
jgi:hypothetical protein